MKFRFVGMKMMRFILVLSTLMLGFVASANELSAEQHRAVKSRKVGSELLLVVGDSLSRVKPIVQEGNRFTIEFEAEFSFQPEVMMAVVDDVLKDSKFTSTYFLEVLSCGDNAIVYNTLNEGVSVKDSVDFHACGVREYPVGCYKIAITFQDVEGIAVAKKEQKLEENSFDPSDPYSWGLIVGAGLLAFSGYAYFRRKKEQNIAEHIIPIGAYKFNQRNMHLTFKGETVELTSKEADLLFLLHSSKNETVERDTILRIVWGDEGDYVGRTLDVFISKLRKKLSDDPGIKIANIRGVGYRLVVDTVTS